MEMTLSFVKGKGYLNHNERKFKRSNVDENRVKDNIYFKQESLEESYEKLFGEAVEKYNEKQKRADRKKTVEGYLQSITNGQDKKNAEKPFYESIVMLGDKFTAGILNNPEEAQKTKAVLMEYVKTFQERNPNLYLFNASLHMDEETPHLHLDYIPVARGYKTGLEARNSLSKALEQQGIGSSKRQFDNATIEWQKRERAYIAELAKGKGIEVVELGEKREDLSLNDYKRLATKAVEASKIASERVSIDKGIMSRLFVSKAKLEQLEEREKAITAKEAIIEQAIDRTKRVNETYEKARAFYDEKMSELDNREQFFNALSERLAKEKAEAEKKVKEAEKLLTEQRSLNERHTQVQAELVEAKRKLKQIEKEKEARERTSYENGYLDGQLELLSKENREVVYWNDDKSAYGVEHRGSLTTLVERKVYTLGVGSVSDERAKELMKSHANIIDTKEKRKREITKAVQRNAQAKDKRFSR